MGDLFLDALAKPEPVPGGGAAAAHGACVGLGLLEKIVAVELLRSHAPLDFRWEDLHQEVKQSSSSLLRLRDEDGKAYVRFARAKIFGKSRNEVLEALQQAIECPIEIMEEARKSLDLVAMAGKHCKVHLLSDLLVVGELLQAAIDATYWIAQANLSLMNESSLQRNYQSKVDQILAMSRESFEMVVSDILERARAHLIHLCRPEASRRALRNPG